MEKIVFIGDKSKGFFIDDVASKSNLEAVYIEANGHIRYQVNDLMAVSEVRFMVFDIDQYIDTAADIVKEIDSIRKCNNAKAIIYASGYLPTSTIIVELLQLEIKEFIFATNLTDMKDQLEKCMNGYYEINGIEELNRIELAQVEEEAKENYNFKMIGVAGSMGRIGTTTQALHIVKYLIMRGYKACYVNMNNTDMIEKTKEWWNTECDDEMGKVTFENVDHFYKVEKISDIKKLGYDYYVYDYGSYFNTDFNKISFLEKDIKIFVIGYKAQEMENSYKLIDNSFYDDAKYILSFADELSESEAAELMSDKMKDTILPKRCTEPYVLVDIDCYDKIISVENKATEQPKKKKGFWKFGKGKHE